MLSTLSMISVNTVEKGALIIDLFVLNPWFDSFCYESNHNGCGFAFFYFCNAFYDILMSLQLIFICMYCLIFVYYGSIFLYCIFCC